MIYFGNETPLKHKLMEYDKESLKGFAQDYEVKGAYKMKKEELAEAVAGIILDPQILFYRMAVLTDEDIENFEKGCGCIATFKPDDYGNDSIGRLNEYDLIVLSGDRYFVPNDLAEVWKTVKTEEFEKYRKRASWVWKCLYFAEEFYGYTPVECLLDVVNTKKGMCMKEDELYEIFEHFPLDQLWTVRVRDIFVESKYMNDLDRLDALRRAQAGKEHYVPTAEEVEEFYRETALISDKPYQDLMKFLEKEMGMTHLEAYDLIYELFYQVAFDDDPHGTMQWFWNQFEFADDKQVEKIVSLYMTIANGTRMLANRGFKPCELADKRTPIGPGNMPVITAGSTHAANMLSEIAPKLKDMGFTVDLDEGAGKTNVLQFPQGLSGEPKVVEKKIYPNDPCPCGSGKKYKKCCGKNT